MTWVGLMAIEAVKPRFALTALPVHLFLLAAIILWGVAIYRNQDLKS